MWQKTRHWASLAAMLLLSNCLLTQEECAEEPRSTPDYGFLYTYSGHGGNSDSSTLLCYSDIHGESLPILRFSKQWAARILGIHGGAVYVITQEKQLEGFDLAAKTHFRVCDIPSAGFIRDGCLWGLNPNLGGAAETENPTLPLSRFADPSAVFRCFNLRDRTSKELFQGIIQAGERLLHVLRGPKDIPLVLVTSMPSEQPGFQARKIHVFLFETERLVHKELSGHDPQATTQWHFDSGLDAHSRNMTGLLSGFDYSHSAHGLGQRVAFAGNAALALLLEQVDFGEETFAAGAEDTPPLFVWDLLENRLVQPPVEAAEEDEAALRSEPAGVNRIIVRKFGASPAYRLDCDEGQYRLKARKRGLYAYPPEKDSIDLGHNYAMGAGRWAERWMNYRNVFLGPYTGELQGGLGDLFPLREDWGRVFWRGQNSGNNDTLLTYDLHRGKLDELYRGTTAVSPVLMAGLVPHASGPPRKGWAPWEGVVQPLANRALSARDSGALRLMRMLDEAGREKSGAMVEDVFDRLPEGDKARRLFEEAKRIASQPSTEEAGAGGTVPDPPDSMADEEGMLRYLVGIARVAKQETEKPNLLFSVFEESIVRLTNRGAFRSQLFDLRVLPGKTTAAAGETINVVMRLTNRSDAECRVDPLLFREGMLEGRVIGQAQMRKAADCFARDEGSEEPVPLGPGASIEKQCAIAFDRAGTYDLAIAYAGGRTEGLEGLCKAPIVSIQVGTASQTAKETRQRAIDALVEAVFADVGSGHERDERRERIIFKLNAYGEPALVAFMERCGAYRGSEDMREYTRAFDTGIQFGYFRDRLGEVGEQNLHRYFHDMGKSLRSSSSARRVKPDAVIEHFRSVLNAESGPVKRVLLEYLQTRPSGLEPFADLVRELAKDHNSDVACLARSTLLAYLCASQTEYNSEMEACVETLLTHCGPIGCQRVGDALLGLYESQPALQTDPGLLRDIDSLAAHTGHLPDFLVTPYAWLRRAAEDPTEERFNHCAKIVGKLEKETGKSMGPWPHKQWASVQRDKEALRQCQDIVRAWADYVEQHPVAVDIP